MIQTVDRGSVLDGTVAAVVNEASVDVLDNTSLTIQGAINNVTADHGAINLESVGNTTQLIIGSQERHSQRWRRPLPSTTTPTTRSSARRSAQRSPIRTTPSRARGQLGDGQLTLVNQTAGVIDASGADALVLNTGAATVTNAGLLEGTGTGGLVIIGTTVNNTGTIIAGDASNVFLQSAVIDGGVLTVAGTGFFQTNDRR